MKDLSLNTLRTRGQADKVIGTDYIMAFDLKDDL